MNHGDTPPGAGLSPLHDTPPHDTSAHTALHDSPFLAEGVPLADTLRRHDWSRSALGAPATWPAALRQVVSLMLDCPVAMWLGWGPGLNMVYNEAYATILGRKHPKALGAPLRDVWSEIWPDIEPLVEATLAGKSLYREDLPLLVNRQGHAEQAWFSFS